MDKSLPKLSVLSIVYKLPDINPLYITIHSKWMRTDLLCGNRVASEITMEALRQVAE